jgi:hypothetical protein
MELWRSTQSLDCAADWAKARLLQEKASLAEAELLSGGVSNSILAHRYILTEVHNMLTFNSRWLG